MHSITEVGLGRLNTEVIVIAHQNVSMQGPLIAFAGLQHHLGKCPIGFVCPKQIFAVITPVDDVIAGSLILYSC